VIVVDTSVWVAARRKPAVFDTLQTLIDADEVGLALPVRLELLAGTPRQERKAFARGFGALVQMVPTEDTWTLLPEWITKAADAGHRFAMTDLVIAALAAEVGGLVWSLDSDFERMADLGFVGLYG
jgi:predicted nucleic acid-binding protein